MKEDTDMLSRFPLECAGERVRPAGLLVFLRLKQPGPTLGTGEPIMIRACCLAIALAVMVWSAHGQAQTEDPADKAAAVHGTVLSVERGDPLSRVEVRLTRVRPSGSSEEASGGPANEQEPQFPAIPPVLTDSEGKFHFNGVDPGSYRLRVVRDGFVSTHFGSRTVGGIGTIMTLAPGQRVDDLLFRLQRASTVSGSVRDSQGEPVAGMSVSLLKPAYDGSGLGRSLVRAATAITDDRGEYRLFWINPGHYYLSVSEGSDLPFSFTFGERNMVERKGYPVTYYPGTLDSGGANLIDLQPGGELRAVDLVLSRPPTFKIRGTVSESGSEKPPKNVDITLRRRDDRTGVIVPEEGPSYDVSYANGVYEVRDVPAGSYWLRATVRDEWDRPLNAGAVAGVQTTADLIEVAFGGWRSTQVPIDVIGSDLNAVALHVTPGTSIPIRFRFEDASDAASAAFSRLRVALWPKFRSADAARQRGATSSDGRAVIEGVQRGEYRVYTGDSLPGSELYIKEAAVGRADALNDFFTVADDPSEVLEIVLSSKTGQIEGTLTDAVQRPVPGLPVVLVPDKARHRDELYKTADTDQNGRFRFRRVPPGDYKIFAWESIEPFEYYDPQILEKYGAEGKAVRVREGSSETVDVRMIPAAKN